jgi:hypothetical protein
VKPGLSPLGSIRLVVDPAISIWNGTLLRSKRLAKLARQMYALAGQISVQPPTLGIISTTLLVSATQAVMVAAPNVMDLLRPIVTLAIRA